MPNTITQYYSFTPATKARSSQVNTNFSNYRGTMLPINENTISASDSTHHLGNTDHRWDTAYVNDIDFVTSTTTATLILEGSTSATAGAFNFLIEGVTAATIDVASGLKTLQTKIITSGTHSVTLPADVTYISILFAGGGGAGGSSTNVGGARGGGGGTGCVPISMPIVPVTASSVLTCTVGAGGTPGAVGASGGPGGTTTISGTGVSLSMSGGNGGAFGAAASGGSAGAAQLLIGADFCIGGSGVSGNPSTAGTSSIYAIGGAGAAGPLAGGGGGAGLGNGGAGGDGGVSNGVANGSAGGTAAGGGGGGGASSGSNRTGGAGGAGIIRISCITRDKSFGGTLP